jgi:putative membrane protein
MCEWQSWMGGAGGMMGWGMLLVWIIPIGLIIALVWYLITRQKRPEHSERAIDILEKSYARGDISREEFLAKRDDLGSAGNR